MLKSQAKAAQSNGLRLLHGVGVRNAVLGNVRTTVMEFEEQHHHPVEDHPVNHAALPPTGTDSANDKAHSRPTQEDKRENRANRRAGLRAQIRAALPFAAHVPGVEEYSQHDAELFYLKKQIHHQTQMVIVLEDGRQLHGVIEWYDKHSIKIRGKQRTLVYKSAIKYLYKQGDAGTNGIA
jgi:RNA chaperone Hfq